MEKALLNLAIPTIALMLATLSLSNVNAQNSDYDKTLFVASSSPSDKLRDSQYKNAFIVAHDVPRDGRKDATQAIQKLIDSNPNRTIVFPDGVYLISKSILTPAAPKKSVHLVLGNYAIFKASGNWSGGAVIRLGATEKANDINTDGSNYGLYGGIIDGSGVADGVSIDGGRETKIQNVSIKHTQVGLHIKHGANSGSSDSDISDVNIVGNNKSNSIGVLVEGYDNTISNMRIASVHTGVWVKSGGNSLRNLHPLYIFGGEQKYESSCGFVLEQTNNFLNFCYSDQFATGFKIKNSATCNFVNCFVYWYRGSVPFQTAFDAEGTFNSIIMGMRTGFSGNCPKVTFLKSQKGGRGIISSTIMPNRKFTNDDVSASYVK